MVSELPGWFKINDMLAESDDGRHRERSIESVTMAVVHQIGPSLGHTGAEIALAFQDVSTPHSAGQYTGQEMPYTWVIRCDPVGTIDQCLALTDTGPHAKRWNAKSCSIAVVGEFNRHEPNNGQICSLIDLLVLLHGAGITEIHGHTELPGATSDPLKRCPGKHLDMDAIRKEVAFRVREQGIRDLLDAGVRL